MSSHRWCFAPQQTPSGPRLHHCPCMISPLLCHHTPAHMISITTTFSTLCTGEGVLAVPAEGSHQQRLSLECFIVRCRVVVQSGLCGVAERHRLLICVTSTGGYAGAVLHWGCTEGVSGAAPGGVLHLRSHPPGLDLLHCPRAAIRQRHIQTQRVPRVV